MVRVPFDVEIAKKITNGEVNGNIVTRDGRNARVICWDKKSDSIYNIVALLDEKIMERILTYTINGSEADGKDSDNDLMLEIPEYMTFNDGDGIVFKPVGVFPCCPGHELQPDPKAGSMGGVPGQSGNGHCVRFRHPERISLGIKIGSQPTRLEANSPTRL